MRKEKNMISVKDVHKSFDKKEVLKGIGFEIKEGEIFGLLGPSGAGKTTIIKILTGQLGFDSGCVSVFDKDVNSLSGNDKKKFGIMMDQFGLYERFTCEENLSVFADIYGTDKRRIKEVLESVGLKDACKKSASNLSKGMRARLLLARAFLNDPKIIFLDEPTSGLDPTTMLSIHKEIIKKKEAGCTIFLTTHNMEEAAKLCDHIILLNEGKIVEEGKPAEICRRYNHHRMLKLHLTDGTDKEIAHDTNAADVVSNLLSEGKLETIHSTEPTLESVFLELTGRKLEEEV